MVKIITPTKPPIEKTKDKILAIAREQGMEDAVFLAAVKNSDVHGRFDPKYWDRYVQIIRNWRFLHPADKSKYFEFPPCPVCGGKQIRDSKLAGQYKKTAMTGLRCEKDRHHFFVVLHAMRLQETKGLTFEEAIKSAAVALDPKNFENMEERIKNEMSLVQ